MGYGNRIIDNVLVKGASTEPFTVAEFRDYANEPFTDNDTVIEGIITAARQYVESKCNISIGRQSRKVYCVLDSTLGFTLPSGPLVAIDEVGWKNCDCPIDYEVIDDTRYVVTGESFAQFRGTDGGWYYIAYTAGYTNSNIPEGLVNVIKAIALSMYQQRGDSSWSVPAWVKEQMKQYSRKTWV